MEDYNELIQQRFKKLAEVSAMGVKPYAGRFEVSASSQGLIEKFGNTSKEELEQSKTAVTVAGRIVEITPAGVIDRMMGFDEYLENGEVTMLRQELCHGQQGFRL